MRFLNLTTTPKTGTKDLLKAQRWVVERESNLLPLQNQSMREATIPLKFYSTFSLPLKLFDKKCDTCYLIFFKKNTTFLKSRTDLGRSRHVFNRHFNKIPKNPNYYST